MTHLDERRSARSNVVLNATVECEGKSRTVRVINLSRHGARVSSEGIPAEDTEVKLRCNGQSIQGWVAWVRAPYAGIQFSEPVERGTLIRSRSNASMVITPDNRSLDFRRPGFRGSLLTAEELEIVEEWSKPRLMKRAADRLADLDE